ncbi:MAG: hypothetical protein OSB05_07860 [Akkermansiaceae bacterium]|nr:hypothetical protein [Akkermansiaceae bacterium]
MAKYLVHTLQWVGFQLVKPLMVLGNMNGAFKTGWYLHYPNSNQSGHRVLAKLLMSLQHGAGMPLDDYGDRDLGLSEAIDQRGPLAELMA